MSGKMNYFALHIANDISLVLDTAFRIPTREEELSFCEIVKQVQHIIYMKSEWMFATSTQHASCIHTSDAVIGSISLFWSGSSVLSFYDDLFIAPMETAKKRNYGFLKFHGNCLKYNDLPPFLKKVEQLQKNSYSNFFLSCFNLHVRLPFYTALHHPMPASCVCMVSFCGCVVACWFFLFNRLSFLNN